MPIYEYTCSKCNHTFDKKLSISDRDNPISSPCPNCSEQNSVQRGVGNLGFTYGLGAEAKNNYGGFKEVLQKIDQKTRHMGGKLNEKL